MAAGALPPYPTLRNVSVNTDPGFCSILDHTVDGFDARRKANPAPPAMIIR